MNSLKQYFKAQAKDLIKNIKEGAVTQEDIEKGLEALYSAGIIDAGQYTLEQKQAMLGSIQNLYQLKEH
jgi:hypothetical protein